MAVAFARKVFIAVSPETAVRTVGLTLLVVAGASCTSDGQADVATESHAISIDRYEVIGDSELRVEYEIGGCQGEVDRIQVKESSTAIVVTVMSERQPNLACVDVAVTKSAVVELEDPVASRRIVVGS